MSNDEQAQEHRNKILTQIANERNRQVHGEGFDSGHDDGHGRGDLAIAAACYAVCPDNLFRLINNPYGEYLFTDPWPWASCWDKRDKHDHRKRLIIAAALLVAEIERLDRKAVQAL